MLLGKRGEVDNKILLVLVLVVAVILLSNNGMFTGRAARESLAYIQPQASGTAHPGNVYTSRDPSLEIVSSPKSGGGTQYATGGGSCKCPVQGSPYSREWVYQTCSGEYPTCGTCWVAVPKPKSEWHILTGPHGFTLVERECTVDHYVCGDGDLDPGEECETAADCEASFEPTQTEYICSGCQCMSAAPFGF